MYPFPAQGILEQLERYPGAEIAWVQEEPRNMGAWHFFEDRMRMLEKMVKYIGRADSASTAAGSLKRHQQEQADVINGALTI